MRTPFFPRCSIASKTMGEKPVASKMISNGPYAEAPFFSDRSLMEK